MKVLWVVWAIFAGASYADGNQTLINQYQFNALISGYEVSEVVSDIKNNNVSDVQIDYLSSDLLAANQLKSMILEQCSRYVPVTLNSINSSIPYITNYQSAPIIVNIYGEPGSSGNSDKSNNTGSFYNYTNKVHGFYEYNGGN